MQQSFIIPNLEKINVMDLKTCEQIAKKKKMLLRFVIANFVF